MESLSHSRLSLCSQESGIPEGQFTVKDRGKEGIEYLDLFRVLCHQVSCSVQQ